MPARLFGDQTSRIKRRPNLIIIHNILKFLTSSSILLALNAAMIVTLGFLLYDSLVMPDLLLAASLVTFAVYALNKVTDKVEDSINKPELTSKKASFFMIPSIVSIIAGLFIGLMHGTVVFVVLATPIIMGIVYSVKLSKNLPRLKDLTGVKSVVVAISWGLTGSLLPGLLTFDYEIIAIFFAFVLVRVFVGAVLFDVLDRKGDASSGIETIPIKLGLSRTKKLLIIVNSFPFLLIGYCALRGVFIQFMPGLIFGTFYGFLSIWYFFRAKCSRLTAGVMLDGEWFPLVMITSLLVK